MGERVTDGSMEWKRHGMGGSTVREGKSGGLHKYDDRGQAPYRVLWQA